MHEVAALAWIGAQAGKGTSWASLLTANLASQRMRDFLHGLTNDKAAQLLRDAMRDPELFRDLLTADLRQPAAAKRAETRLTEWMAAQTGVAAGGVGEERQPERQWWMNDLVADQPEQMPGAGAGPTPTDDARARRNLGRTAGGSSLFTPGGRAAGPGDDLASVLRRFRKPAADLARTGAAGDRTDNEIQLLAPLLAPTRGRLGRA